MRNASLRRNGEYMLTLTASESFNLDSIAAALSTRLNPDDVPTAKKAFLLGEIKDIFLCGGSDGVHYATDDSYVDDELIDNIKNRLIELGVFP